MSTFEEVFSEIQVTQVMNTQLQKELGGSFKTHNT